MRLLIGVGSIAAFMGGLVWALLMVADGGGGTDHGGFDPLVSAIRSAGGELEQAVNEGLRSLEDGSQAVVSTIRDRLPVEGGGGASDATSATNDVDVNAPGAEAGGATTAGAAVSACLRT